MKKLIVASLALLCASAIMVQAQDAAPKKHHKLTAEQQQVMDELLAKYDTNKDGKLDKSEKSAMTAEDKAKLAKIAGPKKKAGAAASTNAPAADAAK